MSKSPRNISKQDVLTFRGFIAHDIPASIEAKTNLLTALGLVCYTEFVGGLLRGKVGISNENRPNFYEAYNGLDGADYYRAFDVRLKAHFGADFYDFFRNGLAHEYFAKKMFVISPYSNTKRGVGFHNDDTPAMANEPYYHDLLNVLDKYIETL